MEWIWAIGIGLVLLLVVVVTVSRRRGTARPDTRTTVAEMAAEQRLLWERAEQVVAAYKDARGDEVDAARARVLAAADDADAHVASLDGKEVSERNMRMARLVADEIRKLVDDALARRPEEQQG